MGTHLLADRFRRWFRYERESHGKTLASLESVPAAARDSDAYRKAVGLLAHVVLARWLWLTRLGAAPEGSPLPKSDEEFFPMDVDPGEMRARLAAMEDAWASYLETLDDEALARVFTYRSLDGPAYRNTVEEILTQLFGHSWYHRGQIASLVRALGGAPARTDFVFWARERVDPA